MGKNIVKIALIFAVFGFSQSGIIEQLNKCSLKDSECQRQLYQKMLHVMGESGIPELNIPTFDPFHFENVTVKVFNLLEINVIKGIVKGVKDCKFEEFTTDIENKIGTQKLLCDIVIKGNFKLSGSSPVIASILGGSEIRGEGKTKVKFEKLQIEMSYPIVVKQHKGEVYLTCKGEEVQRKFNVLGKASFAANNIYVGQTDVSEMVTNLLNQNYKDILDAFGHFFYAKAGEIMFDVVRKFFDNVPAKHYILEDLTPYNTE